MRRRRVQPTSRYDLAALRRQLAARDAEIAGLTMRLEVLWAQVVPDWLSQAIRHAETCGWRIERSARGLAFLPPDADDPVSVPLPLPADDGLQRVMQQELHMRLGAIGARGVPRPAISADEEFLRRAQPTVPPADPWLMQLRTSS